MWTIVNLEGIGAATDEDAKVIYTSLEKLTNDLDNSDDARSLSVEEYQDIEDISMTEVIILAGVCGFTTRVIGKDKGSYNAELKIDSECPNWQEVNKILGGKELNVMTELFKDRKTGTLNSQVLNVSLETIPHVSCPVISGVLKTLEVSVGLVLPCNAAITFK